jgi:integrase/recombinase XerD
MQHEIDRFLLALEADGRSPRTITWYKDKLKQVQKLLTNSPPPSAGSITTDDLRRVLVTLRRRGLSDHTIHGYVRTLRYFFRWLHDEGIIVENPAAKIRLPKPKCGEPKAASVEDAMKLLQVADNPRDRAILLVLMDTGVRAGYVVVKVRADRGL